MQTKYCIEWRWNGNWRRDDVTAWTTKDGAIAVYAMRNEKLTETRVICETGKVVWHSDEIAAEVR